MSTALVKRLLLKVQRAGIIAAVTCITAGLAFAATSHGAGNGQDDVWVELGEGRMTTMPEVEETINGLPSHLQPKSLICIDKGKYVVVHTQNGTKEEAEQLRAELGKENLLTISKSQCFAPTHFLKKKEVKFPEPLKGRTSTNKRMSLAPSYRSSVRAKAAQAHKPEVLDNTSSKVLPEVTTRVLLSGRDINRITCGGQRPVKDVIFSTEKGVNTKIVGNNVFVKFLVERDNVTGQVDLSGMPTEMYVVCGSEGTIYSLVAIPKNIPSQTVTLTANIDRIKKNASLFGGLTFEKKVLMIIKQAYSAEFPESYTVKKKNQPIDVLDQVGITTSLVRTAEIEGEGLIVKEYHLNLVPAFDVDQIRVQEKYFLLPQLTENPVAIAMDTQFISKSSKTRLFILEKPATVEM